MPTIRRLPLAVSDDAVSFAKTAKYSEFSDVELVRAQESMYTSCDSDMGLLIRPIYRWLWLTGNCERQRAVASTRFKWKQAAEVFYDIGIPLLINAGTAVASAFGPTLIRNFGFVSRLRGVGTDD